MSDLHDLLEWPRLADYFSGEVSPEERVAAEAWIAEHPERREELANLYRIWEIKRPDRAEAYSGDEAWSRIAARLEHVATPPSSRQASLRMRPMPPRRWMPRRAYGVGIAAALVLSVAGATLWRQVYGPGSAATVVMTREYATRTAQQATIDLPDGSRVQLAPDTRVRYTESSAGARTVELAGQAYFMVTPDPRRTFTVQTGGVRTRVLGTVFDVRKYDTDRVVQVAVVSGKVSAGGNTPPIVLVPGTLGQITDSSATIVTGDATLATSWTQGRLVFRNTPISAILESASRWCGYEFRVADPSIVTQHVTMTLVVGKPDDTMRALRDLLDVRMMIDGNVVTLYPVDSPKKSAAPTPRGTRTAIANSMEVGK